MGYHLDLIDPIEDAFLMTTELVYAFEVNIAYGMLRKNCINRGLLD